MNVDRVEKLLAEATAIGQLITIEQTDSGSTGPIDENEAREHMKRVNGSKTFVSRIAPSLALSEKEQLLKLLLEFQAFFADKRSAGFAESRILQNGRTFHTNRGRKTH